jgi:DNA-binding NarL/FixJ family response regulator
MRSGTCCLTCLVPGGAGGAEPTRHRFRVARQRFLARSPKGRSTKDIGAELGLAASTVRSHLHNVYITLGVSDRAQAVLRATEMGWL